MSRVLYFDCFSGISGDMVLGALIDAGLPFEELRRALGSLALSGVEISSRRVLRAGVTATQFVVREVGPLVEVANAHDLLQHRGDSSLAHSQARPDEHSRGHAHRSLPEIFGLIDRSGLSAEGRSRAKALFQRLGETEASIHQMTVEQVHLHEVGAVDSIIDIVGAVFALEWFGADRIVSSPLNVGGGMVDSAHGRFPVPAPATLKLLGDAPIYGGTVREELVTPTGALIVSSYASAYGPIPPMSVDRTGYGAGGRDLPATPNVLRVLIGRAADHPEARRVTVIECDIDDMNPQIFGVVMERLYAAGALEVCYLPVQMKKNRPGTRMTIIAPLERRSALAEIVFRETTTIGLRYLEVERECLEREIVPVDTPLGVVRFKVAWRNGSVINAVPEFDDCARLAAACNLPVKEVQTVAFKAFDRRHQIGDSQP
jgi:uncharacterized protein (TIGR00299 family) protein